MDAIETIERDGYVGEIHHESCPSNPREGFGVQVSTLTQLSNRYAQPDKFFDRQIVEAWDRYSRDTEKVERYARAFLGAVATDWWDDPRSSSRIFGYIAKGDAERYGLTDPLATLNAEMREYAAWCEGEVYGYVVTAPDGNEIDSCWGYYGDDELDYVRQCINEAIDTEVAARHAERVAMYRRLINHVA